MKSFLFYFSFAFTVCVVVLIVQSVRVVLLHRRRNNTKASIFLLIWLLLKPDKDIDIRYNIAVYLSIMSGHYLTRVKKYQDTNEDKRFQEQLRKMSQYSDSFERELFVPCIVVPIMLEAKNESDVMETIKNILDRVCSGAYYGDTDPSIHQHIVRYSKEHDIDFVVVSAMLEIKLEHLLNGTLEVRVLRSNI